MSEVELVIKIQEKDYDDILNGETKASALNWSIFNAIRDGVALPKGHGQLKDTDAICKDIISALGIRDEKYLLESEKAIYKRIKNALTIIEADVEDKEQEEERI